MKVYLFTETCIDVRNVLITPYHGIFKTKEDALNFFASEEESLISLGYVFQQDTTNSQFIVQKDYSRNDKQVRISVCKQEVIK